MLKDFKTYQLAVTFHKAGSQQKRIPYYLKEQFQRATSSVVLNLAEGSAKLSAKDQGRFYSIAYGSLRESQAIIELSESKDLENLANQLGASIFRLLEATKKRELNSNKNRN